MSEFSIDKQQARKAFSRAALNYDEAAILQHEIGNRVIQRLDYVKLEPKRILDIGCGTGKMTDALMRRYPKAEIIALDFALPMLNKTRKQGRIFRRPKCLCADLDFLPFAADSFDLIYSNASLQWSTRPQDTFIDLARILRPEGLLMFSSFGPHTLHELRTAWSDADNHDHVHGFIDMHDYGDMLVHAGFADPVMDAERITMTYKDIVAVMADLKVIGAANASTQRNPGLTGKKRMKRAAKAYEQFRTPKGELPATYEVVYGHAWGTTQRRIGGATLVSVDALRQR